VSRALSAERITSSGGEIYPPRVNVPPESGSEEEEEGTRVDRYVTGGRLYHRSGTQLPARENSRAETRAAAGYERAGY